ncbi:YtxH domain-containing protein [Paenibacillus paeoniae]|uniref:YtxH domain-containing protein n=1 Tax=Paenibacillus paeoniae TaxID=2292705 RepID=A0A371P724_9BACL|nr:YtxH domain-containing protein [Paenibacillus paeoniae]REK71256.1 YtxH domain-containing protein [Paenibacillus paeoniae]
MSKNTSTSGIVVGALVGGAVGAITALLFAPKSGQQLRSDIGNGLESIGLCAKELATSVSTHTKELVTSVSEQAKDSAQAAVEGVKADVNSMAPTEEDMVKLGKEMDQMPTNSEVESKGRTPDPAQ